MTDKFVTINTHGDWEEVTWSDNDTPETAPPIVMALITPSQLQEYRRQEGDITSLRNENAALRRKVIELSGGGDK